MGEAKRAWRTAQLALRLLRGTFGSASDVWAQASSSLAAAGAGAGASFSASPRLLLPCFDPFFRFFFLAGGATGEGDRRTSFVGRVSAASAAAARFLRFLRLPDLDLDLTTPEARARNSRRGFGDGETKAGSGSGLATAMPAGSTWDTGEALREQMSGTGDVPTSDATGETKPLLTGATSLIAA